MSALRSVFLGELADLLQVVIPGFND